MDLLPSPVQVVAAAGNVASLLLNQGLADLRPASHDVIGSGDGHRVLRFRPEDGVPAPGPGDPVLLVPPVALPWTCYDLRRGCSLVERLVDTGRPTYAVDLPEVSFRERDLDLAPWLAATVAAVRTVADDAGGRPVHLVGWSLGGTLALLAAASEPDLPLASLSLLATPTDTAEVPMVAPLRPLPLHPLLRRTTDLLPLGGLLAGPLSVATHLDDREYLAQVEAVARLGEQAASYRGRAWGQLHHRFLPGNALASGTLKVGRRRVALAKVRVPVLVLAGAEDGIAPVAAVRAVLPHLTGSPEARLEIVPGGHLGMLTGRGARDGTWPVLEEWFQTAPEPASAPRKRAPRT
ncbi:alpha/beta fold hydrolase [Nocardioides pantholopis]|uniref:alpha/beta fold hydrolase n=1 Tax=Nocardioides pantholopis TaxID=2483798 RepID=UPI000FDB862E|nr:alpha/beta fold hydrolase [Nocardioides pantholopis]